jgi:hypothetical protein
MKKNINGIEIQMTADEITEFQSSQITINQFDVAIKTLRLQRNKLLADSDWWGASDKTMTAEQTQYRQDLRDITNGLTTVEQVEAVEFPEKP